MFASVHALRHDRAFIDDKLCGANALTVVRVDGKRRYNNGIVFLRLYHDVLLRNDVFADHAAAFTHIELWRPMIVVGELIAAEADLC